MKTAVVLCALIQFLSFFSNSLFADTFAVQGVLRDPMGKTVADGHYSMTFRLFSQVTGGTAVWEETQGSVAVLHGVYSAELGSVTPLTDVTFNTTYWLGLSINGGAELEPRFKLTTTPASMSVLGTDNVFPSKGNIGVGTHTPTAALHVKNKNNIANVLLVEDANGNKQINTTASGQMGVGTAPTADLHIKTANSSDKMLIEGADGTNYVVVDATGKLGLKVDAPTQALDIDGNIKMRNGGIMFDDGSTLTSAKMGGSASSVSNEGTTLITSDSDNNGTGNIDLITGSTTRMTVNSTGKIGIGTSAPTTLLHLKGTTPTDAVLFVQPGEFNSAGDYAELRLGHTDHYIRGEYASGMTLHDADGFYFSGGNTGFGTTYKTGLLNFADNKALLFSPASSSYYSGLRFDSYNQTLIFAQKSTYSRMRFAIGHDITANQGSSGYVPASPEMTIADGKVGINKDSPDYTLDVGGNINFTGTLYKNGSTFSSTPWTQSGSNIYYTTGSVGIGTSTPSSTYALDVSGYVRGRAFYDDDPTYFLDANTKCVLKSATFDGFVAIGTTVLPTEYKLDVDGVIRADRYADDAAGYYIDANTTSVLKDATFTGNITMSNTDITGLDDIESVSGEGLGLNYTTPGHVLIATGGGFVGVGTKTPLHKLHIVASNPTLCVASDSWNDSNDWARIWFGDENHEIRGTYGVGMKFSDSDGYHFYDGANKIMQLVHSNGTKYASYDGDSNWDYQSDRRLKENILPETNILDRVLKLNVVNFNFIDNPHKTKEIGLIAQEVEPYFPSLVTELVDENYEFKVKALGYSTFGVLAVGAIKELNQKVENLQVKLDQKDALINDLLKRVEALEKR